MARASLQQAQNRILDDQDEWFAHDVILRNDRDAEVVTG